MYTFIFIHYLSLYLDIFLCLSQSFYISLSPAVGLSIRLLILSLP